MDKWMVGIVATHVVCDRTAVLAALRRFGIHQFDINPRNIILAD